MGGDCWLGGELGRPHLEGDAGSCMCDIEHMSFIKQVHDDNVDGVSCHQNMGVHTRACVCAGSADIMVVEEDALEAQRRIPGSVRINYNAWSHMDFICEWA